MYSRWHTPGTTPRGKVGGAFPEEATPPVLYSDPSPHPRPTWPEEHSLLVVGQGLEISPALSLSQFPHQRKRKHLFCSQNYLPKSCRKPFCRQSQLLGPAAWQLCLRPSPHLQGAVTGVVLCCHRLDILSHFGTRGPIFSLCTGPYKLCAESWFQE